MPDIFQSKYTSDEINNIFDKIKNISLSSNNNLEIETVLLLSNANSGINFTAQEPGYYILVSRFAGWQYNNTFTVNNIDGEIIEEKESTISTSAIEYYIKIIKMNKNDNINISHNTQYSSSIIFYSNTKLHINEIIYKVDGTISKNYNNLNNNHLVISFPTSGYQTRTSTSIIINNDNIIRNRKYIPDSNHISLNVSIVTMKDDISVSSYGYNWGQGLILDFIIE